MLLAAIGVSDAAAAAVVEGAGTSILTTPTLDSAKTGMANGSARDRAVDVAT